MVLMNGAHNYAYYTLYITGYYQILNGNIKKNK